MGNSQSYSSSSSSSTHSKTSLFSIRCLKNSLHSHSSPTPSRSRSIALPNSSAAEKEALFEPEAHTDSPTEDDGTYLLRRGTFESRDQWLGRKKMMAAKLRGWDKQPEVDFENMIWRMPNDPLPC